MGCRLYNCKAKTTTAADTNNKIPGTMPSTKYLRMQREGTSILTPGPSHGCTYCAIAMVIISTPFVYSFMMESKCCSRKDITMPANAPVTIVTEVTFNRAGLGDARERMATRYHNITSSVQ